ncbi:hypothetical protein Pfo_016474 [Paulownia fortunei]|nr:hypothetical protein Pfo_016474 [Paulownia fortunei]
MARLPADDEEFTMETREALPAHFLIKIECFSLLSGYGVQKYESREFEAGDYKWRLIIYPDGHKSEKEGNHISVYLAMTGTSSLPVHWEVNAIFSIFLFNQILNNYLCFRGKMRRFHAMKPEWGFSKLISKKSLTDESNGYLVDDNCVFGAEVFVIKSQQVIERLSLMKVTCPYKRDWKISEFSKLKDVWTSEVFSSGDHQWKIELYPNGNGSEKGRSVSIYLECVDSQSFAAHEKVKADFYLRIKNQYYGSHHSVNLSQWFTSSEPICGLPAFMPIADMRDSSKGFIVYNCCCLEIEIFVQAVVHDVP